MIITEYTIRKQCQQNIFLRGKNYQKNRRVHIEKVREEQDDKSQVMIVEASVCGVSNQVYWVREVLNETGILEADCNCDSYFRYGGMCKHVVATALTCVKGEEPEIIESKSSVSISHMIHAYTNESIAQAYQERINQSVEIIPKLRWDNEDLWVGFRIGIDKKYIIQDIYDFAKAMIHSEVRNYGKSLEFRHTKEVFTHNSMNMVQFIIEQADQNESILRRYQKNTQELLKKEKDLLLSAKGLDHFYEYMAGETVELEVENGLIYGVELTMGNPNLKVELKTNEQGGIKIETEDFRMITGANHTYLTTEHMMYQCTGEYTKNMNPFLIYMGKNKTKSSNIDEKDLPAFCTRVLPHIESYVELVDNGLHLEKYAMTEPIFLFYLDNPSPNGLSCTLKIKYGEETINPLEDSPKDTAYRDWGREYQVMEQLRSYISYVDSNSKYFHNNNEEEALYRFVEQGMDELRTIGEIHVSDSFGRIQLIDSPKVAVGVSLNSQLLNLEIHSEDFNLKEMTKLLSSYKLRKKYHRLKNGEFMKLEDNSLSAISELIFGLSSSKPQLSGNHIELPKYRALYLDYVLNNSEGISFERDNQFKGLIRNMKAVKDSDYQVPYELKDILRSYQKTGYRWLRTMDSYGFGGILADDMGLGKTIQVIALLTSLRGEGITSLIVCPASLVYNWESEIEQFAPYLKVNIIAGPASLRRENINKYGDYDVLITSYDLVKRDIDAYTSITFRFQIIDEAQFIKNHSTQSAKSVKRIKAQTKFALTGTPIENRLSELWSIFDYLMPDFLYRYSKFKEEFEVPIVQKQDDTALQRLKHMIGPFLLRRLKKDVLKDLPDKLEYVTYSRIEGEQQKLYDAYVKKMKNTLARQGDQEYHKNQLQILAELMRLRQICCDPSLCYEDYKGGSAKLDTCMELIQGAVEGNHKVLIFSQFTSMLDIIGQQLDEAGIEYYCLTGSVSKMKRMSMVNAFNQDKVPIFLISLKAGGTGLNLTAADMVIHYDPWWNLAAQNQATDRAHRIGQKNVVSVFKLIAKHTIEEKILQLQENKRILADQVMGQENVSIHSLTKSELMEILE